MLFSHWLFWLKNWCFSTNSSKGFIVSLMVMRKVNCEFKVKRITTNSTNPCFILATFWMCFFSPFHFQALMMKKLSYKYYNKRNTTRDNDNVQSHDQEERKLNSSINVNSGAHTLTHDKIMKKMVHSIRIT